MVSWGVRARTWNAKTPQEQRLEYQTHRLEAHQDMLHGQIKNERRLLNNVAQVAAEGLQGARYGHNASMYGYGSPYSRAGYGGLYNPLMGGGNMVGHPGLGYGSPRGYGSPLPIGLTGGISPHLDPAYGMGGLQARREMAIAHERRRRMIAQRNMLMRRQALESAAMMGMTPGLSAIGPARIGGMPLGATPYMGGTPYLPTTPYAAGTPFLGASPYGAALGMDHMMHGTPHMRGNLFEPMVDDFGMDTAYAELAALNAPPGSVRMRRMSTPALAPIDPILF